MRAVTLAILGLSLTTSAFADFSADQKKDLAKIIQDVLKEKPEIVIEALEIHSDQQNKKRMAELSGKIESSRDDLLNDKTAVMVGTPDAAQKLIVFYDSNCPHCRVLEEHLKTFRTKNPAVTILYRQYPIMGKASVETAAAMIALAKINKFEALTEVVSKSDKPLTKEALFKFAQAKGVDVKKLGEAMNAADVKETLQANVELAKKLGLEGTPVVISATAKTIKMLNGKELADFLGISSLTEREDSEDKPAEKT
jgi:protein-disulfide isomerase